MSHHVEAAPIRGSLWLAIRLGCSLELITCDAATGDSVHSETSNTNHGKPRR